MGWSASLAAGPFDPQHEYSGFLPRSDENGAVACLTLFDMLKAIDRGMTIGELQVTGKTGGKSGSWQT